MYSSFSLKTKYGFWESFGKGNKFIQKLILAKAGPISYKISYEGEKAKTYRSFKKKVR